MGFDFQSLRNPCVFCDRELSFDPPHYIYKGYYTKVCDCGAHYNQVPVSSIVKDDLIIVYQSELIKVFARTSVIREVRGAHILSDKDIFEVRKLALL